MTIDQMGRLFASADMYQVLGYFVITPTAAVTDGLYGGELLGDIEAIAGELDLQTAQAPLQEFRAWIGKQVGAEDADTYFHRVRKDYTHLYTNPQFSASTLFESRFLGNEEGAKGLEIVLAQTVQDQKELYARMGFAPDFKPALRPDHMAMQLAFMQVLRTNQGIALRDGNDDAAAEIAATAAAFLTEHLGTWAIPFFEEMEREAEEETYRFIGQLGAAFMAQELGRL